MAEVAVNPSHTSAGGSAVPAVANSTSTKSPTIFSSSPSSTPRTNLQDTLQAQQIQSQQHHQQQHQQQQQLPPSQQQHQHQPPQSSYATQNQSLPGDGSSASTYPPRWTQSSPLQFTTPDRNISRGLPSIMSGMILGHNTHDPRQPISPRTPVPMGMSDPTQDLTALPGDLTTPRKRSKVSRACDECRRKKIRCDATSESGIEQCSSCKRVGSKCSFSRVPMKRGPSKGYIKELADRLNTLENSISTGDLHSYGPGVPGDADLSPGPSDTTSPPPPQGGGGGGGGVVKQGRKRTLSSSSDFRGALHLQPLTQQPLASRPNERLPSIDSFHTTTHQHPPPPRQLPPPPHNAPTSHPQGPPQPPQHSSLPSSASSEPSTAYRTHSSPNGVGYWKGLSESSDKRASGNFPFDSSERAASIGTSGPETSNLDWDEELVIQYYELIHPTLPLLPHSKARLRTMLADAPESIRDAFLEALYSTVRSNPAARTRGVPLSGGARRASELMLAYQFDNPQSQSFGTQLLYLQTLILMGLEAENHGPALGRGPPKAAWLGAAVGIVYNLKLHSNRMSREKLASGDPDSDEKLGRRAWWVLVVLDRWHAISTSSPLFIPDLSVSLLLEDQTILGAAPYHIARLSCIIGHLAETLTVADGDMSPALTSKLLRGELQRFRESLESIWSSGSLGLVELAYLHVKLLALRHSTMVAPQQLLGSALRIADILASAQIPTTPLGHHFAALALGTLVDLAEVKEIKEEAWKGIEKFMESLDKQRGAVGGGDGDGWHKAIKDLIERRRQARFTVSASSGSDIPPGHGSLQHLAELAVGERSPTNPTTGFNYPTVPHLDMARLQRYGYLGSLVL